MTHELRNEILLEQSLKRADELLKRDPSARNAVTLPDVCERILGRCQYSIEFLAQACEEYASRAAIGFRPAIGADYRTLSYGELWDRIAVFATGAHREWLAPDERVAVCGFAGPDYVVAQFGCQYLRATAVPLQTNMNRQDLRHIMNEAEITRVIVSREQVSQMESVLPDCPRVRSVIVFDLDEIGAQAQALLEKLRSSLKERGSSARVTSLLEIEGAGKGKTRIPYVVPEKGTNPLMTLFYTSGSTGLPKGAMFPEDIWSMHWRRSLSADLSLAVRHPQLPFIGLGFMPLNHLAGQHLLTDCLMRGGLLNFTLKSDMSTLFEDIRLCRPTSLFLVPRVSEMIFQSYQSELLRRAKGSEPGEPLKEEVMAEMRGSFLGDRLLIASTGTAPTSEEVLNFLKSCFEVPVFDGFGSTEAGMITLEGRIATGAVQAYKLAEVPELGYSLSDKPYPRGELRIKTERAIPGYLKNPEATRDLFDEEGYLRTGDIVEERGPGEVKWIDRLKNILKLSQGEFVSLWRLETMYAGGSPFIQQVYLYGSSVRSFILGVVVPNREALRSHFPGPFSETDVKECLRTELNHIAKANQLRGYEIPRDFIVENEPFSKANGLLTESNKPARAKLKARYGKGLEAIYDELEQNQRKDLMRLRADTGVPIREKFRRALAAILGAPEIDLAQPRSFVDLGGDSLHAVQLNNLVREISSVALPVGLILDPSSTIGALADYTERAATLPPDERSVTFEEIHGAGATTIHAEDIRLEKFLSQHEIDGAGALPGLMPGNEPKVAFLTGANGFLGRFLTLELLSQLPRDGKAYCLVRAADSSAAKARLREGFEEGDPRLLSLFDSLSASGRLVPLPGDLMKPRFGLSEETYARIGKEADVLIHNGALVNHAFSYPQLFEPNVLGTVEITRLAVTGKRKAVSFVSSVGVAAGISHAAPIREDEDALSLGRERPVDSGYAVGYSTSKWVGEILLRELFDGTGIPVNIFRCGMILPHSQADGQINTADFFTRLLCGIVYTRIAPASFYVNPDRIPEKPHFDGLPVDFIARSLVRLGLGSREGFATYHVLSPFDAGVSLDTVVDWIRTDGYPVENVDDYARWFQLFGERLRELDEKKRQRSPLPILHQWKEPSRVGREARFDVAHFEDRAGKLPLISEAFIHKCLADLRSLGYLSPP